VKCGQADLTNDFPAYELRITSHNHNYYHLSHN